MGHMSLNIPDVLILDDLEGEDDGEDENGEYFSGDVSGSGGGGASQEWPYGNNISITGKGTVNYTPPHHPAGAMQPQYFPQVRGSTEFLDLELLFCI